jgi:hypothetical protein
MPSRKHVVASMSLFFTAVAIAACSGASIGTGDGSGTGGQGAADGGGADSGIRGLGCGTEVETRTVLCSGVSVCPGLVVDQDVYPGCGFRVNGSTFDIQCACAKDLCPLGTPRTCTDAKKLLDQQNRLLVCAQANEGRCISTSSSTKPTPSSTNNRGCDPQCMVECARTGASNCSFVCGC